MSFWTEIQQGIPDTLPEYPPFDPEVARAPFRRLRLKPGEIKLALANALRYFPVHLHEVLGPEFLEELRTRGRIYMYRYRPHFEMYARGFGFAHTPKGITCVSEIQARCVSAAAIIHMYLNNLDPRVAQYPYELVTYGGNGTVFQNWAQFRLAMKYLFEMTEEQTLKISSGNPEGLFPSHKDAPRLVIVNGMMIPNYSTTDEYNRLAALGVTMYGQMTAGSAMYIGPQGIIHGTYITFLNAARQALKLGPNENLAGRLIVSSGLGGMSGAQAKAGVICGAVTVIAEVNRAAVQKRLDQGWLNESYDDLDRLVDRIRLAVARKKAVSLAYVGNVVYLWEALSDHGIHVDIGSDQTSLHESCAYEGGYFPVGLSPDEAAKLMIDDPKEFKSWVHQSLCRQVRAINAHVANGTSFFDYGNGFLHMAEVAGAKILDRNKQPRYRSYVEGIMGPLYFDYGFGPFRWVCVSGDPADLQVTDQIAMQVLEKRANEAPDEIRQQLLDNWKWIHDAEANNLVVGSQARILYCDAVGRMRIANEFNRAVRRGKLHGPVVIGRDHHDVSGTDSPFRETANIYDGSNRTADMAIHNVIGCSFRGATWVSIHNGGGVGWGLVTNGGFGMVLDGSNAAYRHIKQMIPWDVDNGLVRRAWAGNPGAKWALEQELVREPNLRVTKSYVADPSLIDRICAPKV